MNLKKCFICNQNDWQSFLEEKDFSLFKCSSCGLIKTIKKGEFELNDDQYLDKNEPTKQFKTKKHIYQPTAKSMIHILKKHVPVRRGKKLLDVGCGLGWIVKEASKHGFDAFGIDSSKTFITQGRELLGVNTKVSKFEDYKTAEKFDVIVLSHVVEHIADLKFFLTKIKKLLKPDGFLLIACPNIDSYMYQKLKRNWYALAPGQHLWQFSKKSLSSMLKRNNFVIEECIGNNLYHETNGKSDFWISIILYFAPIFNKGDQLVCISRLKSV